MKPLEKDIIIKEAINTKPGTITRICYMSEQKVKASYKKQGWKVFKVTETSARLGVNYGHIASVIARKAEEQLIETAQRVNNYEWVVENKVRYNNNTGKYYLFTANFNNGHNTKSFYIVTNEEENFVTVVDDLKNSNFEYLMLPSQWTTSNTHNEVKTISFENIYRIGSAGMSITKDSIAM